MAAGIIILMDFDNTRYSAKPANKQKIPVRVPEANMLLTTNIPTKRKNNLSKLRFEVMPKMRNATPAAAALQP